jgi:hypothetical protein
MGTHDHSRRPDKVDEMTVANLRKLDQFTRALLERQLGLDGTTRVIVVKSSLVVVPREKVKPDPIDWL